MNAYEKRRKLQQAKAKLRNDAGRFNNLLVIKGVCEAYEEAFKECFGISITVTYARGWYYVKERHLHRSDIERETEILFARVHEQQLTLET